MTLHKLKVAALQHEQREDWLGAIELYRQAIREGEGGAEGGDPSLYNRVGDLAHKAGDDSAACQAWEQAVHRYSDLGFLNSAIALCGKILRIRPQSVATYLELARLQARKRVLYDVRTNLRLYLDQMTAAGRGDAARTAVSQLGNEFPGWRDLDALLDELLDREHVTPVVVEPKGAPIERARGLVFIDTAPAEIERASEPMAPLIEFEAESQVVSGIDVEQQPDPPMLAGFEPTSASVAEPGPPADVVPHLEGLVATELADSDSHAFERIEGFDPTIAAEEEAPPASDEEAGDIGGDLVFLQTETAEPAAVPAPPRLDDPLGHRVFAEALLEHGDRAGALVQLERSLASYQERGEWLHAYQVATELVQTEPQSVRRYQDRVEIAVQLKDANRLCDAYIELADALVRDGGRDKAVAVYRRVLELDDANPRARAALDAMSGRQQSASPDGFIDLGAMLIDDHPRSTRMRTETPTVASDEDETFRDALAEFRRALDQNIQVDDHQSHYDLGIAFQEMGLLEEAVSEFQKALRSPALRLRTAESLGQVFVDQGRAAVAEAVLRGVENGPEGDAEKIGVLYLLGRALDAQEKHGDAVTYYQRVMALDVGFRDVGERLSQFSADRKP